MTNHEEDEHVLGLVREWPGIRKKMLAARSRPLTLPVVSRALSRLRYRGAVESRNGCGSDSGWYVPGAPYASVADALRGGTR